MNRTHATLLGALGAFVASNLIHNDLGLDPAILPASALAALYAWRRVIWVLRLAALAIAVPALSFLDWQSLLDTGDPRVFFNHLALFLAGLLAAVTLALTLRATTRVRETPE
jgi:hypothetical protein